MLAIVDRLELNDYHLYHAARADLLERLGRVEGRLLRRRAMPWPAREHGP